MRTFNISCDPSGLIVKAKDNNLHYDVIEFCKNNFSDVKKVIKTASDILQNNPDTVLTVKSGKYFTRLINFIPGDEHILMFKNMGALTKYKKLLKKYRIYCDFTINSQNYLHFTDLKNKLIWVDVIYSKECMKVVQHSNIRNITITSSSNLGYILDEMLNINTLHICSSLYIDDNIELLINLFNQLNYIEHLIIPYQYMDFVPKGIYNKLTLTISFRKIKFIDICESYNPDAIHVYTFFKKISESKFNKFIDFLSYSNTSAITIDKDCIRYNNDPRWKKIYETIQERDEKIRCKRVRAIMPN